MKLAKLFEESIQYNILNIVNQNLIINKADRLKIEAGIFDKFLDADKVAGGYYEFHTLKHQMVNIELKLNIA